MWDLGKGAFEIIGFTGWFPIVGTIVKHIHAIRAERSEIADLTNCFNR